MSSSNVIFVYVTVYHTIPWINHLFQNGRLSLTYIVILLSPTSGNPDVFDINTQPSASYVVVPIRTNISRRFFLRFRTPVVVEEPLQPQCRRDRLLIFVIVSENSTASSFSCHRSLRCCVPLIVQWQLRRFWRLITHRSLCFVLAVLLLSFTPATVSQFCRCWRQLTHRSLCFVFAVLLLSFTPATVSLLIFVNCKNSTGFDIFWNIVRFVLRFLCRCRVSLQPQFAILPTG